jgi:manganese/zinc/iron transport system substrate-binding protein
MMLRRCIAALLVGLLAAACSSGASADRINVVATTSIIADAVKIVGGAHVNVSQLMAAGTNPHTYEAAEGDKALLLRARIVFANGLTLEAGMSDLIAQVDKNTRLVLVSEAVPPEQRLTRPDTPAPDPHFWQDVSLWELAVEKIRDELSGLIRLMPTITKPMLMPIALNCGSLTTIYAARSAGFRHKCGF